MRKAILRTLGLLAVLVLVLYAGLCWWIAGEIFSPPRKALQAFHREWLEQAEAHGMEVNRLMADGVPVLLCEPSRLGPGYRGRILRRQVAADGFAPPVNGKIMGTLVLLHGRGQRKEDLLPVAERFCAMGLRCLLPDLPGHGENPARVSRFGFSASETGLPARVLKAAAAERGFNAYPAGLWGMSMGGAYAVAAASSSARWDAVVLVSTFDALDPLLNEGLGRRGPWVAAAMRPGLRLAIRLRTGFWSDRLRPIEAVRKIEAPVFVAHGMADTLIRPERGRELFQAVSNQPKRWVEVAGARHGNVLVTPHHLFAEMTEWYLAWMSPAPRALVPE